MTTILVIEDDEYKAAALLAVIRERFPAVNTKKVVSLHGGLSELMESPPNLLLLDMSIPSYEPRAGEPSSALQLGGEELLGHMDRFDIEVPVILVTQFDTFGLPPDVKTLEQVDAALKKSFPLQYKGYVFYDATVAAWRDALAEMIRTLLTQ